MTSSPETTDSIDIQTPDIAPETPEQAEASELSPESAESVGSELRAQAQEFTTESTRIISDLQEISHEQSQENEPRVQEAEQIVAEIEDSNARAELFIQELGRIDSEPSHETDAAALEEIEGRLSEILSRETTERYKGEISAIKNEKIAWVQSDAFGKRILQRGASEEDLAQVRQWLLTNIETTKVHLLPSEEYTDFVKGLAEHARISGSPEDSVLVSEGLHTSLNPGCPPSMRESVMILDKARPPMEDFGKRLSTNILRHELGHAMQDGLLESELYADVVPKTKEGAPDPTYIGTLVEIDVRIRAMYSDLGEAYDPTAGPLTLEHLNALKKIKSSGKLSHDSLDLLAHVDDDEIVRLANILPAI